MNIWEEFLNSNPDIKKKIDGLPLADPMAEMVDSAIQDWTAQKRDVIFEFTPERRELLIKIVKMAVNYSGIQDSPFYQYIRAYEMHLYFWLLELQRMEVQQGHIRKIDYLSIFEEVMAEAFILGYVLRIAEPPKKRKRG